MSWSFAALLDDIPSTHTKKYFGTLRVVFGVPGHSTELALELGSDRRSDRGWFEDEFGGLVGFWWAEDGADRGGF